MSTEITSQAQSGFHVVWSQRLPGAVVRRGGPTAPRMSHGTDKVYVNGRPKSGKITLTFSIASKGGGTTEIEAEMGTESVDSILTSMLLADPNAFIWEYLLFSSKIRNFVDAECFVEASYGEPYEVSERYSGLNNQVDTAIKTNAIAFDLLSLVAAQREKTI
jgi:hypothetical protein